MYSSLHFTVQIGDISLGTRTQEHTGDLISAFSSCLMFILSNLPFYSYLSISVSVCACVHAFHLKITFLETFCHRTLCLVLTFPDLVLG